MVKPNYAFAKRQKDLAKKAKNEEKLARKRAKANPTAPSTDPVPIPGPSGQDV
jgi:hypothetical protein